MTSRVTTPGRLPLVNATPAPASGNLTKMGAIAFGPSFKKGASMEDNDLRRRLARIEQRLFMIGFGLVLYVAISAQFSVENSPHWSADIPHWSRLLSGLVAGAIVFWIGNSMGKNRCDPTTGLVQSDESAPATFASMPAFPYAGRSSRAQQLSPPFG